MNKGWKPIQTEVLGAMDDRKVAALRLMLGVSAALIAYAGSYGPGRWSPVTYAVLAANALYDTIVYLVARRREIFPKPVIFLLISIDVAVYSLLVSLSTGTNSTFIFFFFYFFVILVACSRLGAIPGFAVAAACAFFYMGATYVSARPEGFDWSGSLVSPMYLMVLGSILSYWSAAEYRFKCRLALLKELSLTANPRLGVDRTAGLFMQRVLEFFRADMCVFAQFDPAADRYLLRRATRLRPQGGVQVVPASDGANQILAALPRAAVAVYADGGGWRRAFYRVAYPLRRVVTDQTTDHAASIADWLKAGSFMAVPLRRHEIFRGYLCLGASRSGVFKMEDALFLLQVADQVMPVLEHIRLVDHLASDAADEERRRIARSIHDRIIQPYLGLQIGLKAVHQMIQSGQAGDAAPSPEKWRSTVTGLESLITMTRDGIAELRQYVHGLRRSTGGRSVLLESVGRYASKFETATGIHVTVVDSIGKVDIQDRLAADIFQMAAEALSNVHRHTTATAVTLVLEAGEAGTVILRVENEIPAKDTQRAFVPGSISDRADALGGRTDVAIQEGRTVVRVEIPL